MLTRRSLIAAALPALGWAPAAAAAPADGVLTGVGNVLWFVFCGWWLALGHLITGVALCLTIIGIPLGLANFKLIPVSLVPLGREIVPIDELGRVPGTAVVAVPRDPGTRVP